MGDGEKACPCCQFYGVPCRQVRATEDEATIRRNQKLFSCTKRKRSRQEQLADDSLFLDGPSVDELQTVQKRKDPKCSRDTQVENQVLYEYVDGLTITMKVIQPSSAIHHHRMCYQCAQKGHYTKSCLQKRLSPVALVPSSVSSKTGGCNQVQQCQRVCTRQTMKAQDLGPITSPARTSGDEAHLNSGNCSNQGAQNDQDQQQVIPGVRRA